MHTICFPYASRRRLCDFCVISFYCSSKLHFSLLCFVHLVFFFFFFHANTIYEQTKYASQMWHPNVICCHYTIATMLRLTLVSTQYWLLFAGECVSTFVLTTNRSQCYEWMLLPHENELNRTNKSTSLKLRFDSRWMIDK